MFVVVTYTIYICECDGMVQLLRELKNIKWRPQHIRGIKQDLQDRISNLRKGRKEVEDTDKVGDANIAAVYDENLCIFIVEKDLDAKVRRFGTF